MREIFDKAAYLCQVSFMDNFNVNFHSSICIGGDIYIDPFKIKEEKHNASAIFITHSHSDHLSLDDIKKVAGKDTYFVAPRDCIEKLKDAGFKIDGKHTVARPGDSFLMSNPSVSVQVFPSYNLKKTNHPKINGWVGYVITLNGTRYAICGDSDFTPDLAKVKCDVLFIPIGGTYTMDAKEAAEAANAIKPKIVVPVHYNTRIALVFSIGSKKDEKIFLDNLDKSIDYKIFL